MYVRAYDPDGDDYFKLEELASSDNTWLGTYYQAPCRVVVEIQNQIIGFAALTVGSGPCSHCGTVRIHVAEAWRGGQAGDALMKYILHWADDNGIWRIEATPYVCDDIVGKQRFFERYGFVVEGWKRKAAIKDEMPRDVLLMALVVD